MDRKPKSQALQALLLDTTLCAVDGVQYANGASPKMRSSHKRLALYGSSGLPVAPAGRGAWINVLLEGPRY